MSERHGSRGKHRHARSGTLSGHLRRAPETANFLRRAAPAFFKEMSKEYSREIVPAPHRPNPNLWPETGIHAAWLGHSTVLLKIEGTTILTDPVFSTRVGLNFGPMTIGIKRLVEVALSVEDLPPIDLIVLSHAHMDHFDIPSLRLLENAGTRVVTPTQTADLLRPKRYEQVHELRWRETANAGPARVTAFEVAHWGARMRSDVYRGYNGYLIEVANRRIVFGGDTAYTNCFKSIRSSKPIELAIMPIGAYDPWIRVHCNPEQAWEMANDAGAEHVLPVHHQTFALSRESKLEPIERLLDAAGAETQRVCLQEIGHEWHRN